jgi:hypothetical protein
MKSYLLPYEKQITSQHGEDGIIEQMIDAIHTTRNKQFLEIGWGDGGTNMTWHLMTQQGWTGVGVDAQAPKKGYDLFPTGFHHFQEFVYPSTCRKYLEHVSLDCDFFSLDIDSFDYEIAKELMAAGFRPKTVCVEINKFFGAKAIGSFPYEERTKKKMYHKLRYSGVSLMKYIKFWEHYGYQYFGYDSSCTNAFFYKKNQCHQIDLPILRLEDFPYQDHFQMLENIKGTFWEDKEQEIFQKKFKCD